MDKIYPIENCNIKICLEVDLIRLNSDAELWRYLNGHVRKRLEVLVNLIKSDYQKEFNANLKISKHSMMVEIWVHICSDYFGLQMLRFVKAKWLRKLLNKGIKRAEVIDCGTRSKDSNRWIWDILASIEPIIFWFGPQNITAKKLK